MRARPLDRILVEAGVTAVDVVKVDVEGFEVRSLGGFSWLFHGGLMAVSWRSHGGSWRPRDSHVPNASPCPVRARACREPPLHSRWQCEVFRGGESLVTTYAPKFVIVEAQHPGVVNCTMQLASRHGYTIGPEKLGENFVLVRRDHLLELQRRSPSGATERDRPQDRGLKDRFRAASASRKTAAEMHSEKKERRRSYLNRSPRSWDHD